MLQHLSTDNPRISPNAATTTQRGTLEAPPPFPTTRFPLAPAKDALTPQHRLQTASPLPYTAPLHFEQSHEKRYAHSNPPPRTQLHPPPYSNTLILVPTSPPPYPPTHPPLHPPRHIRKKKTPTTHRQQFNPFTIVQHLKKKKPTLIPSSFTRETRVQY